MVTRSGTCRHHVRPGPDGCIQAPPVCQPLTAPPTLCLMKVDVEGGEEGAGECHGELDSSALRKQKAVTGTSGVRQVTRNVTHMTKDMTSLHLACSRCRVTSLHLACNRCRVTSPHLAISRCRVTSPYRDHVLTKDGALCRSDMPPIYIHSVVKHQLSISSALRYSTST